MALIIDALLKWSLLPCLRAPEILTDLDSGGGQGAFPREPGSRMEPFRKMHAFFFLWVHSLPLGSHLLHISKRFLKKPPKHRVKGSTSSPPVLSCKASRRPEYKGVTWGSRETCASLSSTFLAFWCGWNIVSSCLLTTVLTSLRAATCLPPLFFLPLSHNPREARGWQFQGGAGEMKG